MFYIYPPARFFSDTRKPRDFAFTSLVQKDWRCFYNSDAIPDTKKLILIQEYSCFLYAARICSPPISVNFPHCGKVWIFESLGKKFQYAYHIRNFILNNFALQMFERYIYGSKFLNLRYIVMQASIILDNGLTVQICQ